MSSPPAGAPAAGRAAFESWLTGSGAWIEPELVACLESGGSPPAPALREAMGYALLGGGKRLRPALVRLICAGLGGSDADALPAALAIELVHTYSLVHDDLPCMDDDDLRRGRATCHRVYGEAMAVLVGDALQSLAFERLAAADSAAAAASVRVLARAAGAAGMAGGQALDMTLEGGRADAAGVRAMHALKTAALIGAAAELGALAAGAEAATRARVSEFGRSLGRLFQAVDDVLDVTGDAQTLGKTPGKDERAAKPTLVAALGLQGARAEVESLRRLAREQVAGLGLADPAPALALVEFLAGRRS